MHDRQVWLSAYRSSSLPIHQAPLYNRPRTRLATTHSIRTCLTKNYLIFNLTASGKVVPAVKLIYS